jgi:hypothetical protein
MVEVDVVWSYGLGASFAVAASRQLLARRRLVAELRAQPSMQQQLPAVGTSVLSRWSDPYLTRTLLFLAVFFVPSGVWLVWGFPSWETMHVGDKDMPMWLVSLFALTNVTQGLLGYLITEWLLARRRAYLAWLQIVAGYLAMFVILVHGWDGTGYMRFFSPTHSAFVHWHGDWTPWFTSGVAISLYGMAAILVPLLMRTLSRWQVEGYALDPARAEARPGRGAVSLLTLTTVLAALALAVIVHLVIAVFGMAAGIPVAVGVTAAALMPRGPMHTLYRAYGLPERGLDAPAQTAMSPTTAATLSSVPS